jgi:hypothetical protein
MFFQIVLDLTSFRHRTWFQDPFCRPQTQPSLMDGDSVPCLPLDILLVILRSFQPCFERDYVGEVTAADVQRYNLKWKAFANFRLLNTLMNQAISPIAHRMVAIAITRHTDLGRVAKLFIRAAPYVHSVIIYGYGVRNGGWEPRHPMAKTPINIIGRGLELCTQIRSLECYGIHSTFVDKQWLSKYVPNLSSTLKTLSIYPYGQLFGLLSLAPTLEHLEIFGWKPERGKKNLKLPDSFPYLTHLSLQNIFVNHNPTILPLFRHRKEHQRTFPHNFYLLFG